METYENVRMFVDDEGRVVNHGKMAGYFRKDQFGRLFIDRCESDEQHLANPVYEGGERPGCRKYIDDLMVPDGVLGKNVRAYFELRIVVVKEPND